MSYGLRIAAQAKQDLRDVWRGFTEFSGLAKADAVLEGIEEKFQLLLQFPRSGVKRDELREGLRSFPAGEFVVFYRVEESAIEVVRVLHGRRDTDAIFDEEADLP